MGKSDLEITQEAIVTGMQCYAQFCRARGSSEDTEKNRHDFMFFTFGTVFQWMHNAVQEDVDSSVVLRWPSEAN